MTRLSELVKIRSNDWPVLGLVVVGLTVVVLAGLDYLTLISAVVILTTAFILAWAAQQRITWGRYS